MNTVLKALRQEEKKWSRQMEEAGQRLATVRKAMELLGGKATGKKHKRSAAARRKMSLAAKKRWAKIRAEKKSGG